MRTYLQRMVLVILLVAFQNRISVAQSDSVEKSAPLTLEEAILKTFQQNPELKSMNKDIDAAKTKVSKARSWEDTEIGVRLYQVPFGKGLDDAMDIDYIARQKFPLGGKTKAVKQMAYHQYQHHIHLLDARGRELMRDLKTSYFSLFAVQREIAVSREIEGNLRAVVQGAQARLAVGQAMATDASLGQTEIAKVLVERENLFQKKRELEAKLRQIMALAPEEEIQLPQHVEIPRWSVELDELLQVAEIRHPTLVSEKHHIEEKEWGVKAAKREYIPNLNVQLEYVQRPGQAEDAWTGEFMVNVPLIYKKKELGVKQAEAELASAQFSKQAKRNDLFYQVRELYSKMKANDRILSINRRTFYPQARQSFSAAFSAYTTGKVAFSDILNAARMLFDAQMQYWQAAEDQAQSVFGLEEAIGATQEEFAELEKAPPETSNDMKVDKKMKP